MKNNYKPLWPKLRKNNDRPLTQVRTGPDDPHGCNTKYAAAFVLNLRDYFLVYSKRICEFAQNLAWSFLQLKFFLNLLVQSISHDSSRQLKTQYGYLIEML